MTDPSGADLEAIGIARHRDGDYAGAIDAYERAHAAFTREGDALASARAARTVGWFRGWIFGDWAVHQGWNGRARSTLETAAPNERREAWLLIDAARAGRDLADQRRRYSDAIAIARRCGDVDLECEARVSLGVMLVYSGLVDEGMGHLDEALAALCADYVTELPVLEGCLCGLFSACEQARDVCRAEQWLRAADDVIARRKLAAVAGSCRGHYAGILIAAGRWTEAELELENVIRSVAVVTVRASAVCRLAELRIRQGRLEDATALLVDVEYHEGALRPTATLHLLRGAGDVAAELLDRALSSAAIESHAEAPLLALAVDARLVIGDSEAAAEASARLTVLAEVGSSAYLEGLAALARSKVCEAVDETRACLHHAMVRFGEARLPYELAVARFELARALASDRPEAAANEAAAALAAFEKLGARRDADAAAALLRLLGFRPPARARSDGALTRREREVLELLGSGLSNAEIARRLYISPKTAEHHVGRVLSKLGLRSRAEAVAHVVREKSGAG